MRQVYGVSYNKLQNRLYYSVPTTVGVCNVSHPSGNGLTRYVTENSIYSLAINSDGTLNSAGRVLIAKIPTQTQIQCVNDPTDPNFNMSRVNYGVISDIEFNHDFSSMLIAERTLAQRFQPNNNPMKPTDLEWYAHESRVFRYDLSGSTWSQAVKYSVGNYNGRLTNSSGGVDFGFNDYGTCGDDNACEDAMVGLSDALRFENVGTQPYTNIYGILISDINGNSSGYPGNSYFIDIDGFTDGLTAIDAKSTLGDIEVFDNNCLALPSCTLGVSCNASPQTICSPANGIATIFPTGDQGHLSYL
ncbi:MAG: hypothetical protein IPL95_19945 [Saprospiraceae bacterium]|nr:hypothetical protein [Saprospiraceae bacterium]